MQPGFASARCRLGDLHEMRASTRCGNGVFYPLQIRTHVNYLGNSMKSKFDNAPQQEPRELSLDEMSVVVGGDGSSSSGSSSSDGSNNVGFLKKFSGLAAGGGTSSSSS